MKRLLSKNLIKVSLAIGAIWLLTGCGASKSSTGGFEAASTDNGGPSVANGDLAIATCSSDVAALSDFQVQVMQYASGTVADRPDLARVKIVKAPAEFISDSWKVVMYRWTVAEGGSTSIDETPLPFQFERKDALSNFQQVITGTAPSVYKAFYGSQIQGMVDYANQFTSYSPLTSATATEFFQKATFLVNLNDPTRSFQAIRIALKKDGVVKREMDVLIPTFPADPNQYNADLSHPLVLQQIHPIKAKLGGKWTQNQYLEFTRSSCF